MSEFRINGFLQASYQYDALGRQAIRSLTSPSPVTIHSVFDSQGRRIAEYDEATGALLREYIWNGWDPVALIEGGTVYYVRADHIGRPVFATNSSGVKVWEVSYLPFGGVHTQTGNLPANRFPGQWFQSESGLHQNWMRDYDPMTGRYLEPDPLGLVDGASVYGYVRQNPGRYVDPRGEDCRVIGYDKNGNALLDCNSGRPYCPPGEDCNWRNPTENIRDPWPEFDQCVKTCLESEPLFEKSSWWPISESYRAQCAIISGVTGKLFRLPFPGGKVVTSGCRRDMCELECVSCEK